MYELRGPLDTWGSILLVDLLNVAKINPRLDKVIAAINSRMARRIKSEGALPSPCRVKPVVALSVVLRDLQ